MTKPSKWSFKAGKIWFKNPNFKVCRHRIAELAEQMNFESVPYLLVIGQRKNWLGRIDKHTWIELENDGKTEYIEPSQLGNPRSKYSVTNQYRMNQKTPDHWVGMMFINKWLKEVI